MSSRFSVSKRCAGLLVALTCAGLAAPAAASADYSGAVLADGPLVYYRLNEAAGATTAADSSANGVNGTYAGGTMGAPAPFAAAGTSVYFDGSGSVTAPSLAPQAHTAELWLKPKVRSQMTLVSHGDPSSDGWSVGVGAKRKLVFTTGGRTIDSRLPVGTGRWSMIDVTWTSTSVTFALNGGVTQYKTKILPVPAPGPASAGTLSVGGNVKGWMDEVALYPAALTRTQIGAHFTATGLPVNTVQPEVSGVPRVGHTLSVTAGTWTGATSLATYQWQQCDPATGDCSDIAGQTGTSLLLDTSEIGYQIQVVETESNAVGSSSAASNQTAPVAAVDAGPVNVTPPTISGGPIEGQTVTADPGTWDPSSGLTFTYLWQRCDVDGQNCAAIDGATEQTYLLGPADVGGTLYVTVTATDASARESSADSDVTDVITAPAGDGGASAGGSGGSGPGAGGGTTAGSATTSSVLDRQAACTAQLASLPKTVSKRRRGFGKVTMRFTQGSGKTTLKAVLSVNRSLVRSVDLRLGGERVKRLRHAPFHAAIPSSRLKPGSTQSLTAVVVSRHGKKLVLKVRLRTRSC